jgi:hypothetical protein
MSDEASIVRILINKKLAVVCADVVRHESDIRSRTFSWAITGPDVLPGLTYGRYTIKVVQSHQMVILLQERRSSPIEIED